MHLYCRYVNRCIAVFIKLQQATNVNASEASLPVSYDRDAVMIRLFDECIRTLSEHGMQRLFVDAIRGGDEGFHLTG